MALDDCHKQMMFPWLLLLVPFLYSEWLCCTPVHSVSLSCSALNCHHLNLLVG